MVAVHGVPALVNPITSLRPFRTVSPQILSGTLHGWSLVSSFAAPERRHSQRHPPPSQRHRGLPHLTAPQAPHHATGFSFQSIPRYPVPSHVFDAPREEGSGPLLQTAKQCKKDVAYPFCTIMNILRILIARMPRAVKILCVYVYIYILVWCSNTFSLSHFCYVDCLFLLH